ncbi:MAG: hypothetical protein ACOYM3_00020 [Terrimicrobiaceae bacterium]
MAKKQQVAGVVDRVEGDIAVVVFKDPDSGDNREVYLDKKNLKKIDLKEGDSVSIELNKKTVDSTISRGSSMLDIEDHINEALKQAKMEILDELKPKKKSSTKRVKKA